MIEERNILVRWLNDLNVTRVIKAWNLAHNLIIPSQMILEGVPTTSCSHFRFKEIFSFDRNQELGYLWYDIQHNTILSCFYHFFVCFAILVKIAFNMASPTPYYSTSTPSFRSADNTEQRNSSRKTEKNERELTASFRKANLIVMGMLVYIAKTLTNAPRF